MEYMHTSCRHVVHWIMQALVIEMLVCESVSPCGSQILGICEIQLAICDPSWFIISVLSLAL